MLVHLQKVGQSSVKEAFIYYLFTLFTNTEHPLTGFGKQQEAKMPKFDKKRFEKAIQPKPEVKFSRRLTNLTQCHRVPIRVLI